MAISYFDDGTGPKTWNLKYLTIYVRESFDTPFNQWTPIRYYDHHIGGEPIDDVNLAPFTKDGFLMVRMRPIFEALGIEKMGYATIGDDGDLKPGDGKYYPEDADGVVYAWSPDDKTYIAIKVNDNKGDSVLIHTVGSGPIFPTGGILPVGAEVYNRTLGDKNDGGYTFIPLAALTTTFAKQDDHLNPDGNLTWFANVDIEWCEADRYDPSGNVIYPEIDGNSQPVTAVDKTWYEERDQKVDPKSLPGWDNMELFRLGPKLIITKNRETSSEET